MVDITSHLNFLCERLQGKDKLFTNLCDEVYAFKMKLCLFIRQLTEGILDAFPTLKARLLEKTFNVLPYQIQLESLLEGFESRFDEFEKEKDNIYHLNEFLQLEVIELKCNSTLKSRFLEQSVTPLLDHIISFCQQLPAEQFQNMRSFAQKYICSDDNNKQQARSRLTDSNLSALMIFGTTSLCPDIEKLTVKQN
ncbi:hypothetical protein RF11_07504 [Thelohanellus kitauei]|uniref:General transcription factor II-I repeat domain-containing protein 2 n=1 Tax=Thelohanellus kitauei TaxID=669202 RepID=A0A0C2IXJ2_THEKT|nr:hypothetical protein RF11_07504 [Thelohanellus kitauei]